MMIAKIASHKMYLSFKGNKKLRSTLLSNWYIQNFIFMIIMIDIFDYITLNEMWH